MKNLFVILLMAVVAFVVWNTIPGKTKKAREPSSSPSSEVVAAQSRLHRRTATGQLPAPTVDPGDEITNMVFTNVSRREGVTVVVTQAVTMRQLYPPQKTPEEIEAARERWREELKQKGEHKEMFAKEEDWKEKSKSITTGMTLEEVIAVMGLPTQVQTVLPTDTETAELAPVPTNALFHVKIIDMAFVEYSPDGKPAEMESGMGESRLPFDYLFLQFDAQEILTFMNWGKEGLSGSTSRIVRQRIGQPEKVDDAVSSDPTAIEPVTPPR